MKVSVFCPKTYLLQLSGVSAGTFDTSFTSGFNVSLVFATKMEAKWKRRLTFITIGLFFFMGGVEYGKHNPRVLFLISIFTFSLLAITTN